jgi:uncharacterized repeat protein (TIGR03803 family)
MTGKEILSRVLTIAAIALGLCVMAQGAPRYQVLHAFGKGTDGAGLWGSVVFDKKGSLYGTTSGGGTYGAGSVFKLTPHADGAWGEGLLHSFDYHAEGAGPTGGLILDQAGHLYGTTQGGGAHDGGDVFELISGPSGWTENILYSFGARRNDAYAPYAGLVMDDVGNLYGTGHSVFELLPGSDNWSERVLHCFCSCSNCRDGDAPFAGVILDVEGNVYGTTENGGIPCGSSGCGVVYEIEHGPNGWHEKVLHYFANNGKDGVGPGVGALFMDTYGALYGTTSGGGSHTCFVGEGDATASEPKVGRFPGNTIGNCGTVFKLTKAADGSWNEAVLYNFKGGSTGSGPGGGVVMDRYGNLYGTTIYGGAGGSGVVYKLAPETKGKWRYTLLHTFTGADGAQPDANLILDDKGNLYGTTATGGAYGGGVVFEITP